MTDRENAILWEDYFYPGTNVLKNLLNIKNVDDLKTAEATYSFERLLELRQLPLDMEIDKNRLNSIHRYIFANIYPFAGQYRRVNMQKARGTFLFIDGVKDIDERLDELFTEINEALKTIHSKFEFADILTRLYTQLIYIHPYREGNGRTIREFLREFSLKMSERIGLGRLELDWEMINKEAIDEYIEVVHLFPGSISSMFMDALIPKGEFKLR